MSENEIRALQKLCEDLRRENEQLLQGCEQC